MITVDKAYSLIQERLNISKTKEYPLEDAVGRIIQKPLLSDREYPPFHRVMMDGIAVPFSSLEAGVRDFAIQGICAAGDERQRLKSSEACLEVMTGAVLPEGCDVVIPYENISLSEEGVASLAGPDEYKRFSNIHLQGSDIAEGDCILDKSHFLNGPHVGISASIGQSKVQCLKSPRINIITTGDELVGVEQTPEYYQIRRSNSHALKASLKLFGFDQVVLSHLKDDKSSIYSHFDQAIKDFDILIYSGGVSKGKFDYLPSCWRERGVSEVFHRVSQKPGKPLWFGEHSPSQTLVLGLPGNPVSCLVCLHRYFLSHREVFVELNKDFVFRKNLTYFLPVNLTYSDQAVILAEPVKIKNSGEFSALAGTDGFIELPSDQDEFKAGEKFRFFSWRPL